MKAIAALALADFLERVRTTKYLVVLGFMVWMGIIFMPPNGANYATLAVGDHRGVYNSAWVGALTAMLTSAFLSLIGFYVVKGAVERDRRTGVGAILAGTPMSKPAYLLGKFVSNFAVLISMVLVIASSAAVMQLVRGEDMHLQPGKLLASVALLALPPMALVAMLAVVFETVPALSGGFGNIAFFVLWAFAMSSSALNSEKAGSALDVLGAYVTVPSMKAACAETFPAESDSARGMSMGFSFGRGGRTHQLETFVWRGPQWSAPLVAGRIALLLPALLGVFVSSFWFDRFDTARAPIKRPQLLERLRADDAAGAAAPARAAPPPAFSIHDLPRPVAGAGFFTMTRVELALLLKGNAKLWIFAFLVLAILCSALPLEAARFPVLPLLWIWPMLVWSKLGVRERLYDVAPVLFSCAKPVRRLLLASWAAGFVLAAAPAAILMLRLALAGDGASVAAVLIGAAFVPSLALAAGVWTGSSKLFEAVYLVMAYGILNRAPAFDFMGATHAAVRSGTPLVYAALTLALLAAALAGRARQVRT
jgi:hypothetical protein